MTYQIALNAVFQFLIVTLISFGISLTLQAAEPDQSEIDWITLANYQELMEARLTDLEDYLEELEDYLEYKFEAHGHQAGYPRSQITGR